jgi:uncharacterized protein YbjT (DUF2867 family)
MKIIVLGASGFLGRNIIQRLADEGYDITAGVHSDSNSSYPTLLCDFSKDDDVELWEKRLKGFDVVINTVGLIQENGTLTFKNVHEKTPQAIFRACEKAGVKKVIQISALGADEGAKTSYHLTKKAADDTLRQLSVDSCILKPSIIYGEGGKSTALFSALANLPFLPLIDDGEQKLQPIFIDDFVETVVAAIKSKEHKCELNLVGPKALSYKEFLLQIRTWLGKKEPPALKIPESFAIFGKILGEPTISKDSLTMLKQENFADVTPLRNFLGRMPLGPEETLFKAHSTAKDKLMADLYFMRPALKLVIAFVWIWSGLVSAFFYPHEQGLLLLNDVGISGPYSSFVLYIAAGLDVSIGLLMLLNYKLRELLWFQMTVILVYTVILTFLAPYHWFHPFGPVLKNLPLLLAIYTLLVLERTR